MKRTTRIALALLISITALGAMSGCRWVRFPTFDESQSVPLEGATKLVAEFDQAFGELTVRAASEATNGVGLEFSYAPETLKPEVSASVEASTARLRIAQASSRGFSFFAYTRNVAVVTLPTGIETGLRLKMGAGNAGLDLRGIDVSDFDLELGAGNATIDLSGSRTGDTAARIMVGAGNVKLILPRSFAVSVNVKEKGVGNLTARGFIKNGDLLINGEFLIAGPRIDVELVRGVGNVTLELAD